MTSQNVLVVEDSSLVGDALRILLEDAGYTVFIAQTVADAVHRGSETRVDLMLLDLTLPDGDGLDVLKSLRESVALPRVTLAMTGYNDSATRRACLDAGCADLLVKPVPIAELLRQIKHHLA
ncbi:MAG TPA: response regulator [Gemmatimonadaceae bacterium]|nr:response regulator [Gemmatimonadaceae bacterium]